MFNEIKDEGIKNLCDRYRRVKQSIYLRMNILGCFLCTMILVMLSISVFADALMGAFLTIIVIIVALPLVLLLLVQMSANRTVKAIVAFHTHLQQSQEENTVYAHESIQIITLEIEKIYYLIDKLIDMKRVLLLLRDTTSLQIFSESLQQTLLFMHDDMTRLRFQLIANIENQVKTLHAAHDDIDSLRDINLLRDVDARLSHQIREFEALKVRVL